MLDINKKVIKAGLATKSYSYVFNNSIRAIVLRDGHLIYRRLIPGVVTAKTLIKLYKIGY